MLPVMDLLTLIVALLIAVLLSTVLMYFVIKAAIRNALIEDRAFQAKVQKLKQQTRTKDLPV